MDNVLLTVLFVIAIIGAGVLGFIVSYYFARFKFEIKLVHWQKEAEKRWQEAIEKARGEAVTQSRSVLGGKFVEQVAPYLPEFKYDPTEARFIGSPVDLIVFPGLAKGEPKEIVIMEIKSGKNPRLTPSEMKIRQLVEDGMVRWELIEHTAESEL